MNLRHELLGYKVELSRSYKKNKIIADALASHIVNMLSQSDYKLMDTEDLQLSVQSLSEVVTDIRSILDRLGEVEKSLGM